MNSKTAARCTQVILCILACTIIFPFAGCAIGYPHRISDTVAPVGNDVDAGIIQALYTPSGSFDGWEVRQWAVDSYNAYLSESGSKLKPPVKPGAGVTRYGKFWKMSAEAFDRWASLVQGYLP